VRAEKSVKIQKQAVVNAIILVIILGLFLYLGIQFSRNFSSSVSTQRTQVFTDSKYSSFRGYVFRDESVSEYSQRGIIDYLVEDGERVGVGQQYAVFYPTEHLSDEEISQKQAELNGISRSISRLRSGVTSGGFVSDLAHINEVLASSYYSYIDSVLDGDFNSADRRGEALIGALVDYSVVTGRQGVAEDIAKSLENKKKDLLAGIGAVGVPLRSQAGFYLAYETDGYEAVFNSDLIDGLTPDGLRQLTDSEPATYSDRIIGKTVHSPKWYLALPCDEAEALRYTEGKTYDITFSKNQTESVDMLLESIRIDEDGEACLIFSCYDLSFGKDLARAQDVKILMKSTTGYRIPEEALQRVDGEDGVYILIGTEVEFRRVTVTLRGNGYYIVNTYEMDREENELGDAVGNSRSEIPYLNVNDLIITSGNDLYDGKLID
jgi:hypothetical protein